MVLGGDGGQSNYWLILPNDSGGPEPYKMVELPNPVDSGGPDLSIRGACMNCLVTDGSDFYLHGGFYQDSDTTWRFNKDLWKCVVIGNACNWSRMADAPDANYTTMATYDTDLNKIVVWDHKPGPIGTVYAWDRAANTWETITPPDGIPAICNQAGTYAPIVQSHIYFGGGIVSAVDNNDCTENAGYAAKWISLHIGPQMFTLTVGSSNPSASASVAVSPNDSDGRSGGATPLTRIYNSNTPVTLAAAAAAEGINFGDWSGCDSTSGLICNVTMNANRTVTAR